MENVCTFTFTFKLAYCWHCAHIILCAYDKRYLILYLLGFPKSISRLTLKAYQAWYWYFQKLTHLKPMPLFWQFVFPVDENDGFLGSQQITTILFSAPKTWILLRRYSCLKSQYSVDCFNFLYRIWHSPSRKRAWIAM